MATLEYKIKVSNKKTIWFYVFNIARYLKARSFYQFLSDKPLIKVYMNGKFYSDIRLNMINESQGV